MYIFFLHWYSDTYLLFQVIVGANGSGKSTILKLVSRLYDPTEGKILIDDRDIQELKLDDLRRATSVLFQDYTHFPLSASESTISSYFDVNHRSRLLTTLAWEHLLHHTLPT